MNVNEAFPSNWLKAADLNGATPTVTISEVKMEDIGEDRKPVLYFAGKEKGIVLNKTNATNIADAYGPETDDWVGQKVTLFTTWVDFNGRSVEAIRVRKANGTQPPKKQEPAKPNFDSEDPAAGMDDDIPF